MEREKSTRILEAIDVDVPVTTAYDQWTQFEDFPTFMEGVEGVEQIDDRNLHCKAEIGGRHLEWDTEITEQERDQRIAWRSRDGAQNAGVVTFHRISDGSCRVTLQLDYQPEGFVLGKRARSRTGPGPAGVTPPRRDRRRRLPAP